MKQTRFPAILGALWLVLAIGLSAAPWAAAQTAPAVSTPAASEPSTQPRTAPAIPPETESASAPASAPVSAEDSAAKFTSEGMEAALAGRFVDGLRNFTLALKLDKNDEQAAKAVDLLNGYMVRRGQGEVQRAAPPTPSLACAFAIPASRGPPAPADLSPLRGSLEA